MAETEKVAHVSTCRNADTEALNIAGVFVKGTATLANS